MSPSIKVASLLVFAAVLSVTHAYLYNITIAFKAGGTDQKGWPTLLMQGKPPQRRIVNLGDWDTPLPAGMVRGFGADVDFIPADEVSGIHFTWYDRAEEGKNAVLLDKLIVDPEYLKESPDERSKYTKTFCPDAKDVPTKSWNFIILHRC